MITDKLQQFYAYKRVTALCFMSCCSLALSTPYLSDNMCDTSLGGIWFDLVWGSIYLTQIDMLSLSHCIQIPGMHFELGNGFILQSSCQFAI